MTTPDLAGLCERLRVRGYVYRLAPTKAQDALLRQTAGVCRLVYNLALEQRETWGRKHKITAFGQCREITQLRADYDWIAAAPRTSLEQAVMDLDKAYADFFAGRKNYPTRRRKGKHESFRTKGVDLAVEPINRRWSRVRLPKVGWVKFRFTRPMPGEIRNATVRLTPLGWTIAFVVANQEEVGARLAGSVGIDRGVAVPVMLSTGEAHHLPQSLAALEKRRRRAQKVLARRKRGSNRRRRALHKVAAISGRIARARTHWQHGLTTSLARRYGVVSIEALSTRGMTASARGTVSDPGRNVAQKRGLNRSILNVGWFGLEQKLAYKLEERNGLLLRVNPAHTSQICSDCGSIDGRSRESQARFVCRACGFRCNADLNAAINIERRGNAALLDVEGRRKSPDESSTHGLLTAGGKTVSRSARRGRCLEGASDDR